MSHQSTTVVMPASTARSRPVSVAAYTSSGVSPANPSESDVPSPSRASDRHRRRWASTNPGMTIVSAASTTSAPRDRNDGPLSPITPSSISTSASTMLPTARSSDNTVPPLISTRSDISPSRPPRCADLVLGLGAQGLVEVSPVAGEAVGVTGRWLRRLGLEPAHAPRADVAELVDAPDTGPGHVTGGEPVGRPVEGSLHLTFED